MNETTHKDRHGRVVFGLMLMTVGALAWLIQLQVLEADHVWQFWPLLLVAHGLRRLLMGFWARGIMVIVIGVLFQLDVLDYMEIGASWPLLLVGLGTAMCIDELGRFGQKGAGRE